ncbi:unnamed protein product [Gordionus sp. m RMFG-2023]
MSDHQKPAQLISYEYSSTSEIEDDENLIDSSSINETNLEISPIKQAYESYSEHTEIEITASNISPIDSLQESPQENVSDNVSEEEKYDFEISDEEYIASPLKSQAGISAIKNPNDSLTNDGLIVAPHIPTIDVKNKETDFFELDQSAEKPKSRANSGNWSDYKNENPQENNESHVDSIHSSQSKDDEMIKMESWQQDLIQEADGNDDEMDVEDDNMGSNPDEGNDFDPNLSTEKLNKIFWEPDGPAWALALGLKKISQSNPDIINTPVDVLLPEPIGRCSEALQEKFRILHEKRKIFESQKNNHSSGESEESMEKDFNDVICDNKAFRNPSIYEKLLQYCDIDDSGTNCIPTTDFTYHQKSSTDAKIVNIGKYGPGVYNTKRSTGKRLWGRPSFYEELARVQKTEMERWEKERVLHVSKEAIAKANQVSHQIIQMADQAEKLIMDDKEVKVSHHKEENVEIKIEVIDKPPPGFGSSFENPFDVNAKELIIVKSKKTKWDK